LWSHFGDSNSEPADYKSEYSFGLCRISADLVENAQLLFGTRIIVHFKTFYFVGMTNISGFFMASNSPFLGLVAR